MGVIFVVSCGLLSIWMLIVEQHKKWKERERLRLSNWLSNREIELTLRGVERDYFMSKTKEEVRLYKCLH